MIKKLMLVVIISISLLLIKGVLKEVNQVMIEIEQNIQRTVY